MKTIPTWHLHWICLRKKIVGENQIFQELTDAFLIDDVCSRSSRLSFSNFIKEQPLPLAGSNEQFHLDKHTAILRTGFRISNLVEHEPKIGKSLE